MNKTVVTEAIIDDRARREELGQFLTSASVAAFMASLFGSLPARLRLLDAGAGAGALTSAFVDRCCTPGNGVKEIEATLYEVDPLILDALKAEMLACARRCERAGVGFRYVIEPRDFIQEMAGRLSGDLFGGKPPEFDFAIANPPYRKISSDSAERRALRRAGIETSNLYTGFVALIHRLLAPGGELVAITPRSFCNGPYFQPFREGFLQQMSLRRLHVFDSRQAAFRTDAVLQENIIFHPVRAPEAPTEITVSSSSGETGDRILETRYPSAEIVRPDDPESFIHIPSGGRQDEAQRIIDGLKTRLPMLGVAVSTGRVVDFRLRESLRQEAGEGAVPLLYPCHFNGGTVHWPKPAGRKPNAIVDTEATHPWLVPSGIYLLTKRFTSKEERRRLVACLFDPKLIPAPWIGFENHLNYFHADGAGLDRELAMGLFVYLNSTLVDDYFRRFSGHTQVNATDLRKLPYPDRVTLIAMGKALESTSAEQESVDGIVRALLLRWLTSRGNPRCGSRKSRIT
jgi:adenine-specific DNA-methyltransferase